MPLLSAKGKAVGLLLFLSEAAMVLSTIVYWFKKC